MARQVAYQGQRFMVAYARDSSGFSPGYEFFERLSPLDKAKLMSLFRIAGDHGEFHNPEKLGDLGEGLYEFKSFQIRMPFAYAKRERGLILITHGFIKKKHKTPRAEIDRAWRIYQQDQQRTSLTLVPKRKR